MATSLIISSQQTRFDPSESAYHGLDIKDLNVGINVALKPNLSIPEPRAKRKPKIQALDLLVGADLKLKPGFCYGLVGRNGTGKSTLLRAVYDKLIPGVPMSTRISLLQQTNEETKSQLEDSTIVTTSGVGDPDLAHRLLSLPPLQFLIESDRERVHYQKDVNLLSEAFEDSSDNLKPVRAFRQLQFERLERKLFEAERTAKLRSGARGFDARIVLTAVEKELAEAKARLNQNDGELDDATVAEETQSALDLLTDLHSRSSDYTSAASESRARELLHGLGFNISLLQKPFNALSGGWKMRCLLASALYRQADILILDEPTNFLDLLGIVWLEKHLQSLTASNPQMSIVMVSHDRDFMDAISTDTVVLRDQKLSYFNGNLSSYEDDFEKRKLYMSSMKESHDRQKSKLEKSIQEGYRRSKASGDQKLMKQIKSKEKKVNERMGLQVSSLGHRFKLNRDLAGYHTEMRAEIEVPEEEKAIHMQFPLAGDLRHPGALVSLEKITVKYKNAASPVLTDVDLVIHRGDRIGIIGLNGSGKSTIIRVMTETLRFTSGNLTKHSQLKLGYYSQHAVEELQAKGLEDPSLTAVSVLLAEGEGKLTEPEARSYLGSLGLHGRTASDLSLSKLSGGQLVRLALARVTWNSPQLLVLDEVTTHLDYHAVKALIEALNEFAGAIVLVSHDRHLIKAVVQGVNDRFGSDSSGSESEDELEALNRRRLVYLLKGGRLEEISGVQDFEQSLEKRLEKRLEKLSL